MRIAFDARALLDTPLTGVGEYAQRLLAALVSRPAGDTYVAWWNAARRQPQLPAAPQLLRSCTRMPNKMLNASLLLFGRPRLDRLVRPRPDLFFAPNWNFLAVSPQTPFVLTVHDLSFVRYPSVFSVKRRWWHRALRLRRLLRRADGIIAVSNATADDVRAFAGVPEQRLRVVHSGVSVQKAQPHVVTDVRTKYGTGERFVFALGTMEPRKNLSVALEMFAVLRERYGYDGRLVIAGPKGWSHGSFAAALRRHPFRTSIVTLPYVPDADKAALMQAASCFVYPSVFEGFGFPPLEALALGTPTVVGHHSSLSETAGEDALLCDVYNSRDVARAVWLCLTDAGVRRRVAERAPALRQRYTWDRTAAATHDALHYFHELHAHRH